MKKPPWQRTRAAFAEYRERVRQWRAKPKMSLKLKMNFLEARKNAANYLVKQVSEWVYKDNAPHVQNPMVPADLVFPHLILCDKTGMPRFSLRYACERRAVVVTSIQRERNEYRPIGKNSLWSASSETNESKNFQEQLGGIHPAEFLFSEFIYRNRASIRQGTQLWLDLRESSGAPGAPEILVLYKPLIDRFCGRADKMGRYPLSFQKRRVKEILEVP